MMYLKTGQAHDVFSNSRFDVFVVPEFASEYWEVEATFQLQL